MNNKKILWGILAIAPQMGFAQSSVSVYGVVDLAISSYRGEGAGSRQMLTSGDNQASRIGFKGYESLGGGMLAGFELESGLDADTGAGQVTNTNNQPSGNAGNGGLTFNRKSYVYLQGKDWGQVRLGRDYTPAFWNLFAYDPFRVGVGISGHVINGATVTGFRASNSVGYFSPGCTSFQCKGWFFQGMYAFGENASDDPVKKIGKRDGNLHAFRLGYGGENFDVAIASTTTKNAVAGDYAQRNIGASYLWQGYRLMGLLGENKTGNAIATQGGANRVRFWQVGAWVPVGTGYIPVSYMQLRRNDTADSSARKLAIGYVYPLSKRTALYGTYAYATNKGALSIPVGGSQGPTPIAGGNASGFDLGIRHAF